MSLSEMFGGQRESFYKSALMTNLLEEFWKKDQRKIIYRQFIPFLFYLTLSMSYYYYGLMNRDFVNEKEAIESGIWS